MQVFSRRSRCVGKSQNMLSRTHRFVTLSVPANLTLISARPWPKPEHPVTYRPPHLHLGPLEDLRSKKPRRRWWVSPECTRPPSSSSDPDSNARLHETQSNHRRERTSGSETQLNHRRERTSGWETQLDHRRERTFSTEQPNKADVFQRAAEDNTERYTSEFSNKIKSKYCVLHKNSPFKN